MHDPNTPDSKLRELEKLWDKMVNEDLPDDWEVNEEWNKNQEKFWEDLHNSGYEVYKGKVQKFIKEDWE